MPMPVSLTEISTDTVSLPGVNSDPSSLRGELHRVGQQVEKNLLDLALVADEIAKPFVNRNVER